LKDATAWELGYDFSAQRLGEQDARLLTVLRRSE